jgi:hypothetical protein
VIPIWSVPAEPNRDTPYGLRPVEQLAREPEWVRELYLGEAVKRLPSRQELSPGRAVQNAAGRSGDHQTAGRAGCVAPASGALPAPVPAVPVHGRTEAAPVVSGHGAADACGDGGLRVWAGRLLVAALVLAAVYVVVQVVRALLIGGG